MILKIAKNELRNMFYSPVAWFLIVVFIVQCAFFYTEAIHQLALWQDVAMKNNPKFKDWELTLTMGLFSPTSNFTSNILQNLYLFVPLLTMGLISREVNNGTIKLLYSSPVKLNAIVLGKFVAVMFYNLLLVAVMGIFMVTAIFNIQSPDLTYLVSVLLGYFLLLCAYSAIGIFMSSLSNYQIVSAIGTFTLLFALSYVGRLWQNYDFIRDLTYFLALGGRTGNMLNGLVSTKDVLYFVLVVGMFLGFTILKLRAGRESKPWYIKAQRYALVLVSVLLIGYASSRPGFIGYWDATATKLNTLHPKVQQILKKMGKEPMEVILYTNLFASGANKGFPAGRNDYLTELWERYQRFKPDIKFKYVYYYDWWKGKEVFPGKTLKESAKEIARAYQISLSRFMPPEDIRKVLDTEGENMRVVLDVKFRGKSLLLRTFDDPVFWPDQSNIAAVLKKLLGEGYPTVTFIKGNLERDIHKYGEREYGVHTLHKENRSALINHGFEIDTVNLDEKEIPANTNILVLADPKVDLTQAARNKIRQFIDNGGNMMIYGEPGKQQVTNPVLQQLGVTLKPGVLVQLSKHEVPTMVTPYLTKNMAWLADIAQLIKLRRKNADTVNFTMPGVTEVEINPDSGFSAKQLGVTHPGAAWAEMGSFVVDSVAPVFNPEQGDIKKDSFPAVLALSRQLGKKEQRILVSGDADLMSNIRRASAFAGTAFYNWMDYDRYPVLLNPAPFMDALVTIGPDAADFQKTFYVYILPAAILVLGAILLIRRKRK